LPVERIYPMLEFKPIKRDDVEVGAGKAQEK
jgi:hypothetical protein